MHADPHQPCEKPARVKAPALQEGEILAYDCHGALVVVTEWMPWGSSLELSRDQASDVAPLLDCRLRYARYRPPIAHGRRRIANDENAGRLLDVHEGTHRHPPRPVRLGAEELHDR